LAALVSVRFFIGLFVDDGARPAPAAATECRAHAVLDLTIVPTYRCNFRCRYCYVEFRDGRMTRPVEDAIVCYAASVLPLYSRLNVTWFGGEPLLEAATVERLTSRLKGTAAERGVAFGAFVTTNGYLLTPPTARRLRAAGVTFFHVTMDGPAEYHDRTRPLRSGRGSHSRIMRNTNELMRVVPDAHLTLRMNATDENVEAFATTLEEIDADFRPRIELNVTPVRNWDGSPGAHLRRRITEVVRQGLEMGYAYYSAPLRIARLTFCNADKDGNFQIGPDGQLYKCSPTPDKPEVAVGRLDAQGRAVLSSACGRWRAAPPIGEQCRDCAFLCFCAGGCRLERVRGATDLSCRAEFADVEGLVINRYLAARRSAPPDGGG
jgi:uncharacterized protein